MICNMDAYHMQSLVNVLEKAYHIADRYAKGIKYYRVKVVTEQL